jgi:co-chaperonin GroES (HSP10)
MQGNGDVRPLGKRILVERLEGHGIERVTKGGIIIPATTEARAKTKQDTFRAKVLALGPQANPTGELAVGDVLIVYTWDGGDGSTLYTGVSAGKHRLFIEPDDIVCIVEDDAPSTQLEGWANAAWSGPDFALGARP